MDWGGVGFGVEAGFAVEAAGAGGRFDEEDPWDEVFFDSGASDGRDFFGVRAPVDCDFFDNLSPDSTVPGTAFFSFFFAGPCAAPA